MKRLQRPSEAGATLVVSLIMLTLITLMIMAALAIGSANFRTVTNMQFRDEAIAAANRAIDQVDEFAVRARPAARPRRSTVDLDNDGTTDYEVDIAEPQCVRATIARDHLAEQHLAAAGDGDRVVVEHGLGDPGHSHGRIQRRRSRSGRAHGRARAAEPGTKGRGVHMKRKYKLDQHHQTPPGNGLATGWQRPRWRCFSYLPRRRTSTCSSSRPRPRAACRTC